MIVTCNSSSYHKMIEKGENRLFVHIIAHWFFLQIQNQSCHAPGWWSQQLSCRWSSQHPPHTQSRHVHRFTTQPIETNPRLHSLPWDTYKTSKPRRARKAPSSMQLMWFLSSCLGWWSKKFIRDLFSLCDEKSKLGCLTQRPSWRQWMSSVLQEDLQVQS